MINEIIMSTIIAGSRSCTDMQVLLNAMQFCGWIPDVVLSGGAKGADELGELWATENKIPIEQYLADWNKYGKSAGYRRNIEMAKNANSLIALWDGKSKGTKHMIDIAQKQGLHVFVYQFE